MCVTNDAKSPKSPLEGKNGIKSSINATRGLNTPIIWLGKWGFLMSKQPTMTVSGMDNINITPL